MARTVRDSNLESRTARARLESSGQPYYRNLEPGLLHLGYRKPLAGAGKWLARRDKRSASPTTSATPTAR